jgi:hypothetical protein
VDNVTLTLTAAILARAGLDRVTPNAMAVLVLSCNLPELLIAGVLWQRGVAWWRECAAAAIGIGVHFAFRYFEGGREIMAPASPWLIAMLGLCVGAPMLSNLVGSEIGASRKTSGRGWAYLGVLFLFAWIGGHELMRQRAIETLNARTYSGAAPIRTAAWPTQWNPLEWRGYVATESFWMVESIRLDRDFDPEAGCKIFKPEDAEALRRAMATEKGQAFTKRAKYPMWRITPPKIEAADARAARRDLCPEFTVVLE